MRLNQTLAIEKQTKENAYKQVTDIYQLLQKEPLFHGVSRKYRPLADEGERLPDESNAVQVRAAQLLKQVATIQNPYFDITLGRDLANTQAKASVVVDGQTILENVPATYLLWLEKQLNDLHSVIVKLPTLPITDTWKYDAASDCYTTEPTETARTKKTPKVLVKYEATKEHPAQVDVVNSDDVVGYWSTVKLSGALPRQRVQELRDRIEKLMAAVKIAREEANLVEVPKVTAGEKIFSYLLAE